MENRKTEKKLIIICLLFVLAGFFFMFGGKSCSFKPHKIRETDSTIMPEATGTTDRISTNVVVEQTFKNTTETIKEIGIVFFRIQYLEGVNVVLELWDGNELLAQTIYEVSDILGEHRTYIKPFNILANTLNKELTIKIYAQDGLDTGLAVMIRETNDSSYVFNNRTRKGTLCFSVVK